MLLFSNGDTLDTYAYITSVAQRQAAQTIGECAGGDDSDLKHSKPRMGHGLGQAETDSSKKPRTG